MRDCPKKCRIMGGFTLLEMLIALSITALIGMCIAIMINSMAAGTAGQQDGRRHLVRLQALESRLLSKFHPAACILEAGNGYVVYWTGDANINNAVELNELGMLELNTTTHTLQEYTTVFPGNFSLSDIASANTQYAASTSWYAAAQTAKATSYFPASAVAHNMTGFKVTLDNATATAARLATFHLDLSDGQVTRSGMVAVAIRAWQAPQ